MTDNSKQTNSSTFNNNIIAPLSATLRQQLGQHHKQLQRRLRGFLTIPEIAALRPTSELPAECADIATLYMLDRSKTGKISLADLLVFGTAQRSLVDNLAKTQPLGLVVRGWTLQHFLLALSQPDAVANNDESIEHKLVEESSHTDSTDEIIPPLAEWLVNDPSTESSMQPSCDTSVDLDIPMTASELSSLWSVPKHVTGVEGVTDWFCRAMKFASDELLAEQASRPVPSLPVGDFENDPVDSMTARIVLEVLQIPMFTEQEVNEPNRASSTPSMSSPPMNTSTCFATSRTNHHQDLMADDGRTLVATDMIKRLRTWNDVKLLVRGFLDGILETYALSDPEAVNSNTSM